MARILAVSSHVAFGHVGLSAIVPTLQAMGHDVMAVPSVVLSSHYGYRRVGGQSIGADDLDDILSALEANGWLATLDAVLTGYLPGRPHVGALARKLSSLRDRRPRPVILCDPVLGDDPGGLYVSEDVAAAVRDRIVPIADIVTPNRFELEWLTGAAVCDAASATVAALRLGTPAIVTTSVPAPGGNLANLLVSGPERGVVETARQVGVPNGTGDLLAGLLLGHLLAGHPISETFARAVAGSDVVIRASLGAGELRLIHSIDQAVSAAPLALRNIG